MNLIQRYVIEIELFVTGSNLQSWKWIWTVPKTKMLYLLLLIIFTGCSYSIKDIDVSKADPGCTRECTKIYSQCVSGGSSVGFKTETLRACKEAYEICIESCHRK